VPAGNLAHLGLGQATEREERARQLLLGEAEEEIGLILGQVGGALENPAPTPRVACSIVLVDRVVAGGDAAGADRARGLEQLVELQVVVAERAGDGRAPGQVFGHKGPDHIALEPLLLVDDVIGNAKVLGDAAGVVDVVQGTAAARLRRIGNSMLARQPRLVPQLKRKPDHRAVPVGEDRRNRRGVHPSGHRYGYGGWWLHGLLLFGGGSPATI
jgi:hypothetical protein